MRERAFGEPEFLIIHFPCVWVPQRGSVVSLGLEIELRAVNKNWNRDQERVWAV